MSALKPNLFGHFWVLPRGIQTYVIRNLRRSYLQIERRPQDVHHFVRSLQVVHQFVRNLQVGHQFVRNLQ